MNPRKPTTADNHAIGALEKPSSCKDCEDDVIPGIGNDLIVDWQNNRMTSHEYSTKPNESHKKQVRFSDTSSMRSFPEDYNYSKSYSNGNINFFKKRVIVDAYKIRNALASSARNSVSTSTFHRLESCGINKEEVIGLESLTLDKSPADIKKLRKLLTKSVLLEQEKQKILSSSDDNRIAQLSSIMSEKSGKVARMRAAMAA
mmetsp:Transcript_14806/g.28009  ORF Transcript_14806/g.28009 Transcript_14806/m.28009 type:complete len:202 (-) Transcript_14806:73-678(-)